LSQIVVEFKDILELDHVENGKHERPFSVSARVALLMLMHVRSLHLTLFKVPFTHAHIYL